MSTASYKININKIPDASNIKFGIVVSNWNSDITNNLLKGSLDLLKSKNVSNNNIKVINVGDEPTGKYANRNGKQENCFIMFHKEFSREKGKQLITSS